MKAAMSPDTSTRHVQGTQLSQPRQLRNEFLSDARWWSKATGAAAAWIAVAGLMAATSPLHAQTSEQQSMLVMHTIRTTALPKMHRQMLLLHLLRPARC